MALSFTSSKATAKRKLELREKLWPGVTEKHLWDRKNRDGFATIPRTLPLMLTIMNDLADKGKPVAPVYLELWSRLRDEGFLSLSSPQEMAFASGHTGQRALYTWRDRVTKLKDLGFLDVKQVRLEHCHMRFSGTLTTSSESTTRAVASAKINGRR